MHADERGGVTPTPAEGMFDKDAYNRMRISSKLGEAISGWDDPEMVPAADASHMRDDDYVIGLVFRDRPRAYPIWIVDNYHVVNDRLDGEQFAVISCERCQSGSAFVPEIPGSSEREPLLRSVGFLNATLVLKDTRTGSHWIHWEGLAISRRARGTRLPWIPTYHMEWADWAALHPDTEVMLPPDDARHPDARHGHGREEFFSRPGMDPAFLPSIVGPLDTTYPENEMVLGIERGDEWFAYPLREVQREGGVLVDSPGGDPVVVFAGPKPDGFTMAAYEPSLAGRSLTFSREDGVFRDLETGSRWTIEGAATEGPLQRRRLQPVRSFYLRWHALIYPHRNTQVFRSGIQPPRFGEHGVVDACGFDDVMSALTARGHDVRIEGPVVSQRRPREAHASLTTYVDGDRVHLHRFEDGVGARDYEAFEGAISGLPLRNRATESRTVRIGRLVIESDPEIRFVDPGNIVPIPFRSMRWASLLDSEALGDISHETDAPDGRGDRPGFIDVIKALRLSGFEVLEAGLLPPGQLRVGCNNGIALTIDAERFLLYRFASADLAEAYVATEEHALAVGPFVIRSTPDTMYAHQLYEILYVGDEHVRWSALLGDPALRKSLEGVVGPG